MLMVPHGKASASASAIALDAGSISFSGCAAIHFERQLLQAANTFVFERSGTTGANAIYWIVNRDLEYPSDECKTHCFIAIIIALADLPIKIARFFN